MLGHSGRNGGAPAALPLGRRRPESSTTANTPARRPWAAITLAVVLSAVVLAGCGAAHGPHGSSATGAATNAAPSASAGQTASTANSSHPVGSHSGRSGSSGATPGGAATTRRSAAAVNPFGSWMASIIDVDGTHVGAVTIGMSTAQAEHASGLTPWTAAGGFYRPAGLRPGFDRMFFREDGTAGRVSCIGAEQSAPVFLGQRVQTTAAVGVGDPVVRLRAVYGSQLHEIPKPASGSTASAGYILTVPGGRISFATDDARTRITGIGVGPNATPSTCP